MRRLRSGLLLPPGVDLGEPAFACLVCGTQFPERQRTDFERHVASCARAHDAEIDEASPRTRLRGLLDNTAWDIEYGRWIRENPARWFKERKIDPDM